METTLQDYLFALQLGEAQTFKNITVFPLHASRNGGPAYVTLSEAVSSGGLRVTEISQGGSVPELLVVNQCDAPVLLLDGEELVGAKQNRVLNTTILVREKSETRIPVSCTEQGRWNYQSAAFSPAEVVMEKKVRSRKSRSVSDSLKSGQTFHSDQGEVWQGIAELQAMAGSHSPTHAMSDVFRTREAGLQECLADFRCLPDQQGLLVVIDGEVSGFDMVSRSEAYARLHEKLVRSYALDTLLQPPKTEADPQPATVKAHSFLGELALARQHKFQSVGYGWDLRFEGNQLAGSALVSDDHVIHAAFFRLDPVEAKPPMASLRQRRFHFEP